MTSLQQEDVVENPDFPVLDTLRLVGALGVLITHTAFWAGAYTAFGPWGSLLGRLDAGVAIFFVLSGFLLSRPWLAASQLGRPRPGLRRYYWKRLLRIYPLYLVTAVLALTLIEQQPGRDLVDALVTLTLTDIYVASTLPAGLTQMWSLATEIAFYLVLPLLMLVALGRDRRLPARRVLVLVVVMWAISLVWLGGLSARVPGAEDRAVDQWLPAFLGWFAVGIALALLDVLHRARRTPPRVSRTLGHLTRSPGVCWVMAGALLLVAATPLAGPTLLVPPNDSEAVVKILIYAVVGGLLVFTGVFTQPASRYERVMSLPLLRHLGHISYGIFCIHLPVLHLVMWATGYELFGGHLLQITGLTLLLSLVAAEILYRAVELPFMRFRNVRLGRSTVATSPTQSTPSTR